MTVTTSMTTERKTLVVPYKGITYVFNKTDEKEDDNMFSHRCWWIAKNVSSENTIDQLMNMSFVWVAVKFFGVTYDDTVMKNLSTYKDIFASTQQST